MTYLNVQLYGLTGRHHPAIQYIQTTQDAKKLRLHLKFLTCDFITNERLAQDQPNLSKACSLCSDPVDSIQHVLVSCRATSDIRSRLLPELMNVVAQVQPMSRILEPDTPPSIMTQLILDCCSFNLAASFRIPIHNPGIPEIYRISRDWCFGIATARSRMLKLRAKTTNSSLRNF